MSADELERERRARLRDLEVQKVALTRRGANRGATVEFWKSEDGMNIAKSIEASAVKAYPSMTKQQAVSKYLTEDHPERIEEYNEASIAARVEPGPVGKRGPTLREAIDTALVAERDRRVAKSGGRTSVDVQDDVLREPDFANAYSWTTFPAANLPVKEGIDQLAKKLGEVHVRKIAARLGF